jgi:hypothetical protein
MLTSNLEQRGLRLWVAGDKLRVAPPEKVTPDVAAFIKAHKQEIMAELKPTVIYRNPYPQGTPEARQESLIQVMAAIYQGSVKKVKEAYESGELIPDPRIEAVQQAVLKGDAKLKDFQAVVDKAFLN